VLSAGAGTARPVTTAERAGRTAMVVTATRISTDRVGVGERFKSLEFEEKMRQTDRQRWEEDHTASRRQRSGIHALLASTDQTA
jgi:hypothetical protein